VSSVLLERIGEVMARIGKVSVEDRSMYCVTLSSMRYCTATADLRAHIGISIELLIRVVCD
jgi:hypothetical protein